MERISVDASRDALEAHVAQCLERYERYGHASFYDFFQLAEAVWNQRSGAGIDVFFKACEELLSPLPDALVFQGQFKGRVERTDMAELRRFARTGKVLLPRNGARLFETGKSGLAIMMARSNGPSKGAEWGEFFLWRALQELDMSLLILGDRQNLIFQHGFGPFFGRLEEGMRWIEAQAEPYPFAFYVGNSASGFPALQYAAVTSVGNAISFSGATHTPPEETRVKTLRDRLDARIPGRLLDTKPLFRDWKGAVHLYYPKPHPMDTGHARHLEDVPGVTLFPLDTEIHQVFPVSSTPELKACVERLRDDPSLRRKSR
ncbi:hypothetical protein F1654_13375 [Alkalicaulis satelles]|uniref:Uncharacterized protein n=1 Tax=Alkalicaulis satelles TaxID=2609175 RepID=A0A5M6ZAX2_9PROT|nr:hypothetical protein [Alkalicaulis satelles]KAA5801044.1 hypothetical protein F1654_13375 [Alkalicaulis satelles]